MANDPAFLFYVNDFEGGTRHFTDSELGTYVRLLLAQFNQKGVLPNDEDFLRRFCTDFDKNWNIVKPKFKQLNDGNLQNERLELERSKRIAFCESRRGSRLGTKNKTKKTYEKRTKHTRKTYVERTGNGNGDENNLKDGVTFEIFWEAYNKKVARPQCEQKWNRLSKDEQEKIIKHIPLFLKQITDKQFQPHPQTYLNQRRWEDMIIPGRPESIPEDIWIKWTTERKIEYVTSKLQSVRN